MKCTYLSLNIYLFIQGFILFYFLMIHQYHLNHISSSMPLLFSQTSTNETFNSWTWPRKCSCTVLTHFHNFDSGNLTSYLTLFLNLKSPRNASDSVCLITDHVMRDVYTLLSYRNVCVCFPPQSCCTI